MTEAKHTPKECSTFVPIIFGVLVVGLFMFATLVPIIECRQILNAKFSHHFEVEGIETSAGTIRLGCPECEGPGRVPIWNLWHR